jgi:hypothetical protein
MYHITFPEKGKSFKWEYEPKKERAPFISKIDLAMYIHFLAADGYDKF